MCLVQCSWVLSHIHIQPIDCSNIHHYQSISCCHRDGSVHTDVSNLLQGDKRIMSHKARQILEIIIAITNHLILCHHSHWKWKERQKNTSFPRESKVECWELPGAFRFLPRFQSQVIIGSFNIGFCLAWFCHYLKINIWSPFQSRIDCDKNTFSRYWWEVWSGLGPLMIYVAYMRI